MIKLGYWDKDSDKVRHGNWIYQQPYLQNEMKSTFYKNGGINIL